MSGPAFLEVASGMGLTLLLLAMVLAVARLALGPTIADRIMALDLLTTLALSFVAVFAIRSGIMAYLDVAISIALAGFLATVALARYLLSRAPVAQQDPPQGTVQ